MRSELDQPPDVTVPCLICGRPLRARYHWLLSRWLRPTVHNECADKFDAAEKKGRRPERKQEVPEMYQHFDPEKFGHEKAQAQAVEFGPSAERHSLALIGPARQGKSRLMWKVVQQFFDDLQNLEGNQDWVDQIYFEELMVDFQRSAIDRVAQSRYCFIDNIGCVDSYGRERAQLQSAIRTRVRDNRWTFLTIDNLQNFDPGLADILKSRAKVIYIE